MYDTRVYDHFRAHGGAAPDIREAIAQRLHDAGIDNALGKALADWVEVHGAAGRGRDHGRARRAAGLRRRTGWPRPWPGAWPAPAVWS